MQAKQVKQSKSSAKTEERVREVALRLFAQKGFQATSIRDIAAETGLSISTLYYYVENKEELLFDIIREILEGLLRSAQAILQTAEPPEKKLALLVLLHVWVHARLPLEARIARHQFSALGGEALEQVYELRDRYEACWREVGTEGKTAGVFQVEDVKLATIALIEMCSGISEWYRADGPLSLNQLCLMHANWALGLLRAACQDKPLRALDLELPEPEKLYLKTEE